jgi:hypothetical protein
VGRSGPVIGCMWQSWRPLTITVIATAPPPFLAKLDLHPRGYARCQRHGGGVECRA